MTGMHLRPHNHQTSSTSIIRAAGRSQAVLALPVNKWTINEITAKISSR